MNYRGSYRRLLGNSQAAMLAAIEIYNKPQFDYRDECFVILLVNAWELALKACLSKKGESVFYPKTRNEPYRTLSVRDALKRAIRFFPSGLPSLSTSRNLELLVSYRDTAVHFYNSPGFGALIYALAQTSIVNYKEFLQLVFGVDLTHRITWSLLPLGITPPIDPIEYIGGIRKKGAKSVSPAIQQFINELMSAVREIEKHSLDTGRLLTVFDVTLQSVKKIESADVVVGVSPAAADNPDGASRPVTIVKNQDPNVSHPLRAKEILELIDPSIGSYGFQALVWKHNIKANPRWCWQATGGVLTKYSRDIVHWIRGLPGADIKNARKEYNQYIKIKSQRKSET